ncbi:MAG TPA: response regulator, partial [Candidatus Aminicenantes bacterium]|nr:response regulator [Candidatus Aminicenantes bacterium]
MNDCASIPSSATILSVEDDLAVAEQLKRVLCAEGFRPAWCATLGMARSFLQEATPDLILLDVSLPDGSGFELCREVKRRSTVPVIFLTGHTAEVDRVLGLEIGAEDYVTKPFSVRELLARIRIVLRWTRGRNRVIGNRI